MSQNLAGSPRTGGGPLLEVKNLRMYYPLSSGFMRGRAGEVKAVDDVSFTINAGETLGLVGESGCGKSTTGRAILRAIKPTGGTINYRRADGRVVDLATLSDKELKPYRPEIRMVFQDPYSSLNPRMTVLDIVGEPLRVNNVAKGRDLEERVAVLLQKAGLRPDYMRRYPHAFSGGERQRISIARALALDPRLVVLDEAVSALDVSVRAQILNLLEDLQEELNLTYLFISHDLSVIEHICDRVAVMYVGKLVETAETSMLFRKPEHPYTEALISSVPISDPRHRNARGRLRLAGEIADPSNPPQGCAFHPRCRFATDICSKDRPPLRTLPGRNQREVVACHHAEQLSLQGIAAD
ncbi:MAG: oligopeptide/dipeptide ABC transporter ATP-binding protein [Thermomicrobiales bacterium]